MFHLTYHTYVSGGVAARTVPKFWRELRIFTCSHHTQEIERGGYSHSIQYSSTRRTLYLHCVPKCISEELWPQYCALCTVHCALCSRSEIIEFGTVLYAYIPASAPWGTRYSSTAYPEDDTVPLTVDCGELLPVGVAPLPAATSGVPVTTHNYGRLDVATPT